MKISKLLFNLIFFFKLKKDIYPKFVPKNIRKLLSSSIYFPIKFRKIGEGIQMVFRLSNNYGASVVYFPKYCNQKDYFEMAILKFEDSEHYTIMPNSIITDDEDVLQYESWLSIKGNIELINYL